MSGLTIRAIDDLNGMTFGKTAWASESTVTPSALNAKAGSFALNTSTGNQSVSSLGFTPKVVIFFYNINTADGDIAGGRIGFGVGVSSSDRRATDNFSLDAQTSSSNNAAQSNTRCIYFIGGSTQADYVGPLADGFEINITATLGTAFIVNYLALGGDDLTNVKTGFLPAKTTTGNEAYTGFGFQPDAMLFFCAKYSSPETFDTATNGAWSFGMASSATDRGAIAWRSRNGSNPSVVKHRQSKAKVGISLTDTGVFTECDLVSFDSDGCMLNFTTAGGSADILYYLALKGPRFKVSSFNQATSTGNQGLTGAGFTPKASLMISANDIAANDDSTLNDAGISIGAATGTSERGSIWAGDTHNVSPAVSKSNLDRTKLIKLITVGATPTVNAAADHVSFEPDGQIINNTTVDATSREVLVLWMG